MTEENYETIRSTPQRPKIGGDYSLSKFVLLKSTAAKQSTSTDHEKRSPMEIFRFSRNQKFYAVYCGFAILDKYYTETMLSWIIAETALFKPFGGERVCLTLSNFDENCIQISSLDTGESLFQHNLSNVLRISRCFVDKRCFAYLTRSDPEFPISCHVFRAVDSQIASEFCTLFRSCTKFVTDKYDSCNNTVPLDLDNANVVPTPSEPLSNYSQFEVLFVCRVELCDQKMTSLIVDDAVEEFKNFNERRNYIAEEEAERKIHKLSVDDGFCERRRYSVDSVLSSPSSEKNYRIYEKQQNPPSVKFSRTFRRLTQPMKNAFFSSANNNYDTSSDNVFDDLYFDSIDDGTTPNKFRRSRPRVYSSTRAMILLIGRYDLCLLSLDRKMILLRKKFKCISRIVQGIRHSDHFSFVCPDGRSSSRQSDSYVLRCQSKEIALTIMQTIKTAFYTAFNEDTNQYLVCDACPMHQFAKLCGDLEGLNVMRSHELILQRIGQLQPHNQENVWIQYKKLCSDGIILDDIPEETTSESDEQIKENIESTGGIQRRNIALMSVLRSLCETEQSSHVHRKNSATTTTNNNNTVEPLTTSVSMTLQNLTSSPSFGSSKQLPEIHLCSPADYSSSTMNRLSSTNGQNGGGVGFNLRPSSPTNKFLELRDRARHSLSSSLDSFIKSVNSSDTSPSGSPTVKMVCHFDTPDSCTVEDPVSRPRSSTVGGEFGYRRSNQSTPNKPIRASVFDKLGVVGKDRLSAFRTSFDSSSSTASCQRNGRRMSWRQAIFSRVVSPRLLLSRHSIANVSNLMEDFASRRSSGFSSVSSPLITSPLNETQPRTPLFYRSMWKKVIMDQILVIRIEHQKKLQGKEAEALCKLKLNYEEITPCSEEEVRPIWTAMLTHSNRQSTRFDRVQIEDAVKAGIPKDLRADVWRFLLEQHTLDRTKRAQIEAAPNYRYRTLLKDLTSYQHAILIDLGRTFPGHPYFAQPLGSGQLSLFNILKGYSLYDSEVGYCQGLSFIAGLLLLHMEEEQAFDMLVDLLYRLGLRKQYRPDMSALQVEMYQLSRLVHDKHKDLHEHLEEHEIPILYAAPWFLTLFASAFPLGFVARVFDFVFLAGGLEVVFRIALVLLGEHKELIKHCDSFEAINEFLKNTLPSMSIIQMERIFNQVADMDISRELLAYEVEYHVLQEEMLMSPLSNGVPNQTSTPDVDSTARLDAANKSLKRQNMELLEKLQQVHAKSTASENGKREMESKLDSALNTISSYKCKVNNLENRIQTLELERKSLLTALTRIRARLPSGNDSDMYLSCDLSNGIQPSAIELSRSFSNYNGSPTIFDKDDNVNKK